MRVRENYPTLRLESRYLEGFSLHSTMILRQCFTLSFQSSSSSVHSLFWMSTPKNGSPINAFPLYPHSLVFQSSFFSEKKTEREPFLSDESSSFLPQLEFTVFFVWNFASLILFLPLHDCDSFFVLLFSFLCCSHSESFHFINKMWVSGKERNEGKV
jgi:hypothetical protein